MRRKTMMTTWSDTVTGVTVKTSSPISYNMRAVAVVLSVPGVWLY
jgi:hypothetical protein